MTTLSQMISLSGMRVSVPGLIFPSATLLLLLCMMSKRFLVLMRSCGGRVLCSHQDIWSKHWSRFKTGPGTYQACKEERGEAGLPGLRSSPCHSHMTTKVGHAIPIRLQGCPDEERHKLGLDAFSGLSCSRMQAFASFRISGL